MSVADLGEVAELVVTAFARSGSGGPQWPTPSVGDIVTLDDARVCA